MNKKIDEEVLRLNLDRIAEEPGDWVSYPENDLLILQNAIFQSFFNYIDMAIEDSKSAFETEITPERIIGAMLKRTELEIVDALIRSYNKRLEQSQDSED